MYFWFSSMARTFLPRLGWFLHNRNANKMFNMNKQKTIHKKKKTKKYSKRFLKRMSSTLEDRFYGVFACVFVYSFIRIRMVVLGSSYVTILYGFVVGVCILFVSSYSHVSVWVCKYCVKLQRLRTQMCGCFKIFQQKKENKITRNKKKRKMGKKKNKRK